MHFKTGASAGAITALSLGSLSAQAYEQDKTYKITILHTNDHHGISGVMITVNMVWRRKRRWSTGSAKRSPLRA